MSRDCVVCGADNPVGLRVRFAAHGQGVRATVNPQVHFQGFTGVLHGGLVCALLDDAMWWAIYAAHGTITMTAEITVRYKEPVPVATDLTVEAWVDRARHGLYATAGRILDSAGRTLAEATGKFLPAPPELARQLSRDLQA